MEHEVFITVNDFPKYKISNKGRLINSRNSEKATRIDADGYLKVDLYDRGYRKTMRVHRLVADAFIPNPANKPEVNHKDGNKHNNTTDNLEWTTSSENMIHAYKEGLAKRHASYGMRGKKNPNGGRKGIPVRVVETGEVYENAAKCAKSLSIDERRISECLNGRQRTYRGYHFERI